MKFLTALIFIIFLIQIALSQTASIEDNLGNAVNLYFTGDSTDPKTWYQDAIDGNPDVGIKICGVGPKYVGATYAININGIWNYVLISYRSSTEALSYTDVDKGNGCYYTSPGYLTISPSHLITPEPDVYFAAFPGYVRVAYEDSANPGSLSNFILTSQKLRGDYSFARSFDEDTKTITIQTPTIIFETQAGSFSKPANDPTFGINDERRMVIGVCSESYGNACYDGQVLTSPSFPLTLSAGVATVNDQVKYDRYVVINSIGKYICIGANLKISIKKIQPNPIYYSQILHVNFTIINYRDKPTEEKGGNVKVTTDFDVRVKIYRKDNTSYVVYDGIIPITDDLLPGDSIEKEFEWNASVKSGFYYIEFEVDYGDKIVECVETDNTARGEFEVKPIILPYIYINGNRTNVFPFPGLAYNLTLHLKNSDGINVSNATVYLIEENGLSLFVPTQIWNKSSNLNYYEIKGTKTKTIIEFETDYFGNAMLTIIPTGNPLYSPSYSYLNTKSILGNYSIYLTGYSYDGEPFVFIIKGNVTRNYPLYLKNIYEYKFEKSTKNLPNFREYFELIMNTIYSIFSLVWKLMVG